MAEEPLHRGVATDNIQFWCALCLDLLKEPVTVQCGHSYCRICIETCWDHEENKGEYSCPQCRQIFQSRPVLGKNTMLAEVVENLSGLSTQQCSPCAGPADVACDFCSSSRQSAASKSCLTCLASYCAAHLKPHYIFPALKTHQLVSVTIPVKEKVCTQHNRLMDIYCKTDKRCICCLCSIEHHSRHSNVSAAAERAEEQELLVMNQKKVQKRLQERECELNELVQALKEFKSCCQTAVKSIDDLMDELISSIQRRRLLAKQLMGSQENIAVAQAEELQLQLEAEIAKLRKRDADLDQLSQTTDHIHFIQTFQSLSASRESPDLPPGAVVRPRHSMETATKCVCELKGDIEDLIKKTWPKISARVCAVGVVLPPKPKTREEFLHYCRTLTLDTNTVHRCLSISQQGRRVTSHIWPQPYPHHSDRFTDVGQVLCREGLSERCYWEVSSRCRLWEVAVAYKDISKASDDSAFGKNKKSWSLKCAPGAYAFRHNAATRKVRGPASSRIGVYLDYKAGELSFYSVSDKMTLLHKEQTSFTQPLYPGLWLRDGSNVESAEVMKLW
ncbi:E3 ubiquitin/ISG15 ligase TRIM25-like [Odontesthes bonariensis]|uniref:E3 ubiquitin/ISG15 ligase TRIM25-like n=1 Tax=Odontesthes bonariensis TaxID=219752 RepID=UPI003F589CF4